MVIALSSGVVLLTKIVTAFPHRPQQQNGMLLLCFYAFNDEEAKEFIDKNNIALTKDDVKYDTFKSIIIVSHTIEHLF